MTDYGFMRDGKRLEQTFTIIGTGRAEGTFAFFYAKTFKELLKGLGRKTTFAFPYGKYRIENDATGVVGSYVITGENGHTQGFFTPKGQKRKYLVYSPRL